MSQTTNQILWGQFSAALAAKLGAGATSAAIQVLPSAQLLQGVTATDIGDAINVFSAVVPQWGSSYNPSSVSAIDAYQTILTQIQDTATNGKSIEKAYQADFQTLAAMMQKASDYKISKISDYIADAKIYTNAGLTAPAFSDWFKDNGLQEYNALLEDQAHQAITVKTLLSAAGIGSPLVQALDRLNTEIQTLKSDLAPPVSVNPSASLLAGWQKIPTNPGGLSFDNNSTQFDYTKSVWGSESGTELFGFISVGNRSAHNKQENIISSTARYSIDIEFAAQSSVNITQGNWFDGALLKENKNGPWVAKSQFSTGKSHPYADSSAVFPLLVTRLYVVMNPSISITMDSEHYQSLYQSLQQNLAGGISIGPFAFSGKNKHDCSSICQVAKVSSSQTVTLRDDSNIAQVIAVSNQVMP